MYPLSTEYAQNSDSVLSSLPKVDLLWDVVDTCM